MELDFGTVSWTAREVNENPFIASVLERLSNAQSPTNEMLRMAIFERDTIAADIFLTALTSPTDDIAGDFILAFDRLTVPELMIVNNPEIKELMSSLLDNKVEPQAKQLIKVILKSDKKLNLSHKGALTKISSFGKTKTERAHKVFNFLAKNNRSEKLEVELPSYLASTESDLVSVLEELQTNDPSAVGEVLALNIMNLEHRNYIKKQKASLPPLETEFELGKYDYLRWRFGVNHPSVSDTEVILNQNVINGLTLLEHQLKKKPVSGKHFKQFSVVTGLTTLAGQSLFGVSSAVLTSTKNDKNKDELIPKSSAVLLRCFIKWPFLLSCVDIKNVNVRAIVDHLGKKDKIGPLVCQTRLAGTRWSGKSDYGCDPTKTNDVPTQRTKSLLAALQIIIMTGNLTEYIDSVLRVEYRLRDEKLDL